MAIDHNHLDLHANHLWADYQNNALPSDTVAYKNALCQCQLDGSLESLQRIDALLTRLRQELIKKFTQTQTSVNTADMQHKLLADERFASLLLIISHYTVNVLATQWQHPPTWYGWHQLMTQAGLLHSNQRAAAQGWVHALAVQYADATDPRLRQTSVANIQQPDLFFVLEPIINRLFGSFDNVVRSIQTDMRLPNGLYQAIQQRLPDASKSITKPNATAMVASATKATPAITTTSAISVDLSTSAISANTAASTARLNQPTASQAISTKPTASKANDSQPNFDDVPVNQTAYANTLHPNEAQTVPVSPANAKNREGVMSASSVASVHAIKTPKVGVSSIKSIAASHGIFAELMQDIMTLPVQQNVGSDAYKKVSQFFAQLDKAYPKLDEADTVSMDDNLSDKHKNSLSKAKVMLRKLAEQGNTDAMLHLAVYLMQGKWLDKNQQQGLILIQTAANAQDPRAMRMMSKLYYQGLGVDADVSMGRHWLNLAADKGHEDAKNLIKQMDLAQMMIAERQEEIKSDNRLIKLMAAVAVVAILIVMMF